MTLRVRVPFLGVTAGVAGNANGALIGGVATVLGGVATGAAIAAGVTFTVALSLINGMPAGAATASGQTITASTSIIAAASPIPTYLNIVVAGTIEEETGIQGIFDIATALTGTMGD